MSEIVSHGTNCLSLNIERQIAQRRAGQRRRVLHGGILCCSCLVNPPASDTDRYCHRCRADKAKGYRKKQKLELQQIRARLQSYENGEKQDNGNRASQ